MYAVFALVHRFDQGTMSLVFRNRLTGRHMPNPFIGELNRCCSAADSVRLIFFFVCHVAQVNTERSSRYFQLSLQVGPGDRLDLDSNHEPGQEWH